MLIANLDPPKDQHRDMLAICKTDWEPRVLIDDLFYELKEAAIRSQTPMKLACVVLICQLPPNVQHHERIGWLRLEKWTLFKRGHLSLK